MAQTFDSTTLARGDGSSSSVGGRTIQVVVVGGPDSGRSACIDKATFVVGTGPSADFRLTDDAVSREHVRMTLRPDGVHVRDLESEGGTWMCTLRINDAVLVQSSTITIGSTTLALTIDAAAVDSSADALADGPVRFGEAVGESPVMRKLFAMLERASRSDVSVLIEGESGVGKDLLANGIHRSSLRKDGPFVAVDCGAIAPGLIESELFGHERGAFTGADRARDGAFVQAHGGTLFLDEIGELPLDLQPKLLRALEAREVRPLGGNRSVGVDVRIVAATNRNLSEAASANEFRRDLFYRLAVLRVGVPALRERQEDIRLLARAFLQRVAGFENATLPAELESMLGSYSWPGNVRELRNVISRYTVLGANPAGLFGDSTPAARSDVTSDLSHLPYHEARARAIERFERAYLPSVLARSGNVVVRAAEFAGVRRGSFHRMLHRIRTVQGEASR